MNHFIRVFLKGEPVRWFDFPLKDGDFAARVIQVRFEGFILGTHGYIVHDEIKAMMLCQGAPMQGLGIMQPAGVA